MLLWSRRLTEDSSHRQDEQLQQRVLFLIGQTQEAQLGHFGEVRDSSPYYLMGWRQLWDSGTNRRTVEKSATLSNLRFIFRKTSKLQIKKLLVQVLEQDRYKSFFSFFKFLRGNFHVQPNHIRPRTTMWRQQPGSTHNGKLLQRFSPVSFRFCNLSQSKYTNHQARQALTLINAKFQGSSIRASLVSADSKPTFPTSE